MAGRDLPTTAFGDYRLQIVSDGTFRLDGGAMFGIVPKNLWAKLYPCDDQNRITVGTNVLLVRTGSQNILVDCGMGTKWSPKERELYGIDQSGSDLVRSLAAAGLAPTDIDAVICTHLHFDHVGHATTLGPSGGPVPTFPNAKYHARKDEYEFALAANERTRGSYRQENFVPLQESGQLVLADGREHAADREIAAGVRTEWIGAHTPFLQLVHVERGGQHAFFLGDIIPTTRHLDWAWIMGYDLAPSATLERKKEILPKAAREGWLLVFEHDTETPWGRVRERSDGKYEPVQG